MKDFREAAWVRKLALAWERVPIDPEAEEILGVYDEGVELEELKPELPAKKARLTPEEVF